MSLQPVSFVAGPSSFSSAAQFVSSSPDDLDAGRARSMQSRSATPVFLDLETRSDCDLGLGGRRYAAHPSTEIASVVVLIDRTLVIWTPSRPAFAEPQSLRIDLLPQLYSIETYGGGELPASVTAAWRQGRAGCAHNAVEFDALVWRSQRLPEPNEWFDTLPWARAAGLPGGLDEIGRRLFGVGKDPEGKALVKRLSERRDGVWSELSPDQWRSLLRYNIQDVLLLAGLYQCVRDYDESYLLAAHRVINDRGVAFDSDLARKLSRLLQTDRQRWIGAMERLTDGEILGTDLTRVAFLRRWLEARGIPTENLRRETVERLLATPAAADPHVQAVLNARLAVTGVAESKLQKALELCEADGRLRDQFVYCGSHTGRWTGRGVQPHNLPKPRCNPEDAYRLLARADDYESFTADLPARISVSTAVAALLRPCFHAPQGRTLLIADFSGIEARGLAWCAGEERLLQLFREGGDPYCDLAGRIFGRPVTRSDCHERAVGKVAVLGCGYAMGPARFHSTCLDQGVDLTAVGLTADAVVEAYRDTFVAIAGRRRPGSAGREGGLWQKIEQAAREAVTGGGPQFAGRCRFARCGGDLLITLPSGRTLTFRNARLAPREGNEFNLNCSELVYDAPVRCAERTYGGKLTENIVSAISRDLLADAILGCERRGLPVVMHVHDEIVVEIAATEAESALATLLQLMSSPPTWAADFPIQVEGFWTPRYVKSPPPGCFQACARNGRLLS